MTMFEVLTDAFIESGLFIPPFMLEQNAVCLGCHILNTSNVEHQFFKKNGIPANFRTHNILMVPSGFGKSAYYRVLYRSKDGLLSKVQQLIPTTMQSTVTGEGWMGTAKKDAKSGEISLDYGLFNKYKTGIVALDDYQKLKLLFDGEGTTNDEIYLMTALDTDTAKKTVAYGDIEIDGISMTLNVGMRPTELKLESGMARRFSLLPFFPNRYEANMIRKMSREAITPNMDLEVETDDNILTRMERSVLGCFERVDEVGPGDLNFDELHAFLDGYSIPHFEENLYRNMSIGWSLANGTYPVVKMSKDLKLLIIEQLKVRSMLRTDPWKLMFYEILENEPDNMMSVKSMKNFLTNYYQLRENEIYFRISMAKVRKVLKQVTVDGKEHFQLSWNPEGELSCE